MAELAGLPIPHMDWSSSDAPQALRKFKDLCHLYFSGPLKDKSEEEQISFLLIWSGDEGRELASTWTLTADEKKKLSTYWTKFENYVAPRGNFRLARYKLRTIKQEPSETVDSFLKKVRILVKECKYTNPDERIVDALIFGSNNPLVQSKFLEHDDTLTLDKAINIAITQKATSDQLQDIRGIQTTTVNALRQDPHTKQPPIQKNEAKDERCGNRGNLHDLTRRSLCPAYGTKCEACGKYNHWKAVCRSRPGIKPQGHEQTKNQGQNKRENIHAIDTADQGAEIPPPENTNTPHMLDTPQLYFHSLYINSVSENDTQALLQLQVDSGQVTAPLLCNIDTGAEGNVIPVDIYKRLCPQSSYSPESAPLGLTPSNTTITAFGGHTIPHYGVCELTLSHYGHTKSYAFHVVNTVGPIILGLPTCRDMKLVTLNHGISTTQAETASMPNPQSNADARSELLCQY